MSSHRPGGNTKDGAGLRRLVAPRSIALIGAGAWTDAVAAANAAIGYDGTLWRVHPSRVSTASLPCYRSVAELPEPPDAAFLAVPNHEVPGVVAALAARGAGGVVCFSAGFSETGTDVGRQLAADLDDSAGAMPYFGPNCYGFVNFFDRVAMMPDQVVGAAVERGVALICQSGTIALTLMFNQRSLPVGYLFTVGNQSRLAVEELIESLCDDPRVTAFGLYLEGIKDAPRFAAAAARARRAGKPIAVIKSGRTAAAVRTAHGHTGALAGTDAVFAAFCRQAGLARCDTLATLCETLKVFHAGGVLPGRRVLVMGASGGDMAMTADVARGLRLDFAPLPAAAAAVLQERLTTRVTIANPLDFHTYLWFDPPALKTVFTAVLNAGYDAVGFMLDCPPDATTDTTSFDAVIEVYLEAAARSPTRAALMASLPETLGQRVRRRCLDAGVIPLQGQRESLEALSLAGSVGEAWHRGSTVALHTPAGGGSAAPVTYTLGEHEAKAALAALDVCVPRSAVGPPGAVRHLLAGLDFPVAIKAVGRHIEHKSELGGVILDVRDHLDAVAAAARLAGLSDLVLVEEMITDGVAEILVGVIVDAQFGLVLVLGAGGVFTELVGDSVSLLPPWDRTSIGAALAGLSTARLLAGHRGKPPGDVEALISVALAVARYAVQHLDAVIEIDVNPVIVRPAGAGAVAVDAMIRLQR